MANINQAKPIRFEAGGVLTITDGATPYITAQYEPGTLEGDPGGYEPLNYTDRGVQQSPLEGDERLSTVRFKLKLTSFGAAEAYQILTQRDTSTGLMKQFTVQAKWFNYKGAATFHTWTPTRCYCTKPPKITAGEKFDLLEVEMASLDALPAVATG